MKRFVACLLLTGLFLNILPTAGNAVEFSTETIVFEDGSYIIIDIITDYSRASGSKTASKQYTYYNDNDVSQWKAVLTGKFSYTGSSATCTSSSVSVAIYNSVWYEIYKYATKNEYEAEASVTMGYKLDGVTVMRIPVSLSLTCDKDGNLS